MSEGSSIKNIKGGFQETIIFETWKLIVQFFETTGTIKVIFSNSQHPFDAIGLRNALHATDAVFAVKTGIHFFDIAAFFYIEKIHVGSDILKEREFSGVSRFNCTINQFDNFIFRIYEKVLGGQLYVRVEECHEGGTFKNDQINSLLSLVERQVTPTHNDLMIYELNDRVGTVEKDVTCLYGNCSKLKRQFAQIVDSDSFSSSSQNGNPFKTHSIKKKEGQEVNT